MRILFQGDSITDTLRRSYDSANFYCELPDEHQKL